MAKSKDSRTLDMFEVPRPVAPLPASMNYGQEVAALVTEILKNTDIDRFDVAARMSRLTGREVSKYMIDAWCSEARDAYNLPFYLAPALEAACNTHDLTNWLATVRGGRLLIGRETLTADLGKMERLKAELTQKIRDIKKVMGEAE